MVNQIINALRKLDKNYTGGIRFLKFLSAALAIQILLSSPYIHGQDNNLSSIAESAIEQKLNPKEPKTVSAGELDESIGKGVKHLLVTQRKDGAWGGPQWTGGVDYDPIPGSFRSFDVAVAAMCLEALLETPESDQVRIAKENAYKFLMARTNKINEQAQATCLIFGPTAIAFKRFPK